VTLQKLRWILAILSMVLFHDSYALAEKVEEGGAIVSPLDVIPYGRLEQANSSEQLYLLRRINEKLYSNRELDINISTLLGMIEPLILSVDDDIAIEAVCILCHLGPKASSAIPNIQTVILSENRSDRLRIQAINALHATNESGAIVETTKTLLASKKIEIRFWAAMSLATTNREYLGLAMPTVIEALSVPEHRMSAVSFINAIGPDAKTAIPALRVLKNALKDEKDSKLDLDFVTDTILKIEG